VVRFAHSLCRRVATALAVVAALAFVMGGALGGNHLVPAASAHVGHFHVHAHGHSHAPAAVSDHQSIDGNAVAAAAQHGSSPTSAPDADGNCCTCCTCACSAAALQPAPIGQATPFLSIANIAFAHRRHGDGIVPEGLRRPPRPLSIA
jgi:hypothetical protein